jgi:hypothetical protein
MTVFIIEKYEKMAMSFRYLGVMMIIFVIMSFGYFIWIPELDMLKYSQGIVDTSTPAGWFIFVNFFRILLFAYVVIKYARFTRSIGEETKRRIQWFFTGILIAIIGLFINLLGGMIESILMEIVALIAVNAGILLIFKGFLM